MNAKKILVPVTLAEGSGASLAVASALAQNLEATVVLLHVLPEAAPEAVAQAEEGLQQLAEKTNPHAPVECMVCAGAAAEKIIEKNQEIQAEAIVMSSHGDCGWFNWLHRQTAQKVLSKVTCPVWVIFPGPAGMVPTLSLFASRDARERFPEAGRATKLFPFPASLKALSPSG